MASIEPSLDHAMLNQFAQRLGEVITFVIQHGETVFPPEVNSELQGARPIIAERLRGFTTQMKDLDEEGLQRFAAVGLTGTELRLKLSGFNLWYARLHRTIEKRQEPAPFAFLRRAARSLLGLMPGRDTILGMASGALRWANIIMGSIPKGVIPGAEAVKEVKEVVEKAIEDGEANELPSGYLVFPPPEL